MKYKIFSAEQEFIEEIDMPYPDETLLTWLVELEFLQGPASIYKISDDSERRVEVFLGKNLVLLLIPVCSDENSITEVKNT